MNDELGGSITIEFVELRLKTYSYLINDRSDDEKTKGTRKYII